MYDVVVVGARCAGASTALLLARSGYRVLLVDRAKFPSDTLSTLYIHQAGVSRLADWGVLDELRAAGTSEIRSARYEVADVCLTSTASRSGGVPVAYAPRRPLLDSTLARCAVREGAELSLQTAMMGLLWEDGSVSGVRLRMPDGKVVTERAKVVVGADGMRSKTASAVGARAYAEHPRMTCCYYSLWAGLEAGFEQYQGAENWIGVVPTDDSLTLVAAYFRQSEFQHARRDPEQSLLDAVRRTSGGLSARLAAARRVERFSGSGDQQNFFRTPAGPGWALVGDAGHHKDSITARGITDAFLQADLLAQCLTDGNGERLDAPLLGAGLSEYAARRDDLLEPSYRSALSVARLAVTPVLLEQLRKIQDSPELTARYFRAVGGMISPDEIYDPHRGEPLVRDGDRRG